MREIVFRGKPVNKAIYTNFEKKFKNASFFSNGFVFGSLVIYENKYYICLNIKLNMSGIIFNSNESNMTATMIEVIPETVSQFTGKYINNTRIFDGDILEWCDDYDDSWGFPNTAVTRSVVSWDKNDSCWVLKHDGKDECICTFTEYDKSEWENMNLIGNIYDNPELLLDYNKQVTTV